MTMDVQATTDGNRKLRFGIGILGAAIIVVAAFLFIPLRRSNNY